MYTKSFEREDKIVLLSQALDDLLLPVTCSCRKKLHARLAESEETASATQAKLSSLEKTKNRIASELEDTGYALEDMRNQVAGMEKTKKKFDAEISDWKAKYDARGQELDTSQRDARSLNTEVGREGKPCSSDL